MLRVLPTPTPEDSGLLSYASWESDVDQLGESLQCSWTSSLEQSAAGRQTAGLVIQPFQTVA